jgi:hypothetical protein
VPFVPPLTGVAASILALLLVVVRMTESKSARSKSVEAGMAYVAVGGDGWSQQR